MKYSYSVALRRQVLSHQQVCLAIFRLGGGTKLGVEEALNSTAKCMMALRSARISVSDIERLIEPLVQPGLIATPATWSQIEHAPHTGEFSK